MIPYKKKTCIGCQRFRKRWSRFYPRFFFEGRAEKTKATREKSLFAKSEMHRKREVTRKGLVLHWLSSPPAQVAKRIPKPRLRALQVSLSTPRAVLHDTKTHEQLLLRLKGYIKTRSDSQHMDATSFKRVGSRTRPKSCT